MSLVLSKLLKVDNISGLQYIREGRWLVVKFSQITSGSSVAIFPVLFQQRSSISFSIFMQCATHNVCRLHKVCVLLWFNSVIPDAELLIIENDWTLTLDLLMQSSWKFSKFGRIHSSPRCYLASHIDSVGPTGTVCLLLDAIRVIMIIIHMTIFMVMSSWLKPISRVHPFTW